MKRAWQIACLIFIGFSIFWMIVSFQYPYHDRLGPGPGFFPFWLSLITGGLSLALLIQTSRSITMTEASAILPPDRPATVRVGVNLIALLVAMALFEPLGFRLTLLLFLLFLPFSLGIRTWWGILLFAVLGSFGVFHVFYYWLKVPLPIGLWGI